MILATTDRVTRNTPEHVNQRIRQQIDANVTQTAAAGPESVNRRLEELDREWDIERILEANASSLMLLGLGLGAFVDRRWFILPTVVAGFLLQHAVQGWCPPVPLLRRLGVRTQTEIDYERCALNTLCGDFYERQAPGDGAGHGNPTPLIEVVQR
jgi:hypothetical protein